MDLSTREGRREQGRLIQLAAKEAGLSAEDLADAAQCSRALVYQYYSGATLAQTDRLQRIARAVGKPMAYFFGETGAVDAPPPPSLPEMPVDHERARAAIPERRAERLENEALRAAEPSLIGALADLEELAHAQASEPDLVGLLHTCERIAALARIAGRPREEADAWFRAGNAHGFLGEHDQAVVPLRRALAIYGHLGETALARQVEQSLGAVLAALGRFAEAREAFERVAAGPDWESRWRGRAGLAALQEQVAELDSALQVLAEVLALADEAPSADEADLARCYALAGQFNVSLAMGDLQGALACAEECEGLADRLGARDQRVEALLNQGIALAALGRLGESRRRLDLGRQLADFARDRGRSVLCRAHSAWTAALSGRRQDACAIGYQALHDALNGTDARAKGVAELLLAKVLARSDRGAEAKFHAGEAHRLLHALHLTIQSLEAELVRATLLPSCERGDTLERIIARARERGLRAIELEATIALATLTGSAETARTALDLAKAVGDADATVRAAVTAARSGSREEELQYVGEAVRAVEFLRASEEPELEAVLEDPLRLHVCRRYLALLADTAPAEAREWALRMAWPPLDELGPAGGWDA